MKRKQTIFALLLALALLLSMVGCGASTKNAAPASGADTAASEPVWEDARTEEAAVPDEVTDAEWGETPALAEPGDPAPEPDASLSTSSEKIIYTAWLSLETTDFDRSAAALEAKIQENQRSQMENGSDFSKLQTLMEEQKALEAQLEEKTQRWMNLEELAEKIANQ